MIIGLGQKILYGIEEKERYINSVDNYRIVMNTLANEGNISLSSYN